MWKPRRNGATLTGLAYLACANPIVASPAFATHNPAYHIL